jgi:hypothetical protein
MAMTALASLLAMLAGLARDLVSPGTAGSSPLTTLAAAVLAGAVLAAVLALISSVSRATVAIPLICRASALREKSWHAAFLRQRDPDAPGRARPRAPSAAPAAAMP